MTQQEIHDSLDAMLANPKSRGFINHLVGAYFPIDKTEKVWDKPNRPFKCAITKVDLFSAQDLLEGIQTEAFKTDFMNNLKDILNENVDRSSPLVKLVGERELGLTGADTTTFLSYNAFQELYNWVTTKLLKGDKHINWLLKSLNKKAFSGRVETLQHQGVIEKKPSLAASYTLGETDAFKKLREKFNN